MEQHIKIAIADDEQLILEGLKILLTKEKCFSVCMMSDSGTAFLNNLKKLPTENFPDIALIDVQMKPMDGFELVTLLQEKYPALKVIIVSSHYRSAVLGYMVKLGVSAFLSKNSSRKCCIETIKAVYQNGFYFNAEDYNMLRTYLNNAAKKKSLFLVEEDLSEREREVAKLVCEEYTNREIGEKLFISARTVETHRQNAMLKIGAKNTVGLVIYAIVNHIFTLPLRR